ncbi:MAG: hypothetical protein IJ153_01990 [Clostridia bacterium]|nr:hypothetical protein [Clostridia bacterium]
MARRADRDQSLQQATWTNVNVETNDEMEIDLGALVMRFLEKIHWILLAAFVCAAIAGAYVYFLATPIYEATSKIYIVGSESAISLSDLQIGSNLAADYQEVFKNWHVHELVDQRLGLDYSYTELAGMLSVTNPSNTHVLYITAKSTDPEEAKVLADTYANVAREFIAAKMDIREPNIFEEAMMPTRPVSPRKTRTIAIGFLLGMIAAMAVVTIRFIVDDRITNSDEIAKVGNLPTLGMVPIQDLSANNAAEQEAKKRGFRPHKKNDDQKTADGEQKQEEEKA